MTKDSGTMVAGSVLARFPDWDGPSGPCSFVRSIRGLMLTK